MAFPIRFVVPLLLASTLPVAAGPLPLLDTTAVRAAPASPALLVADGMRPDRHTGHRHRHPAPRIARRSEQGYPAPYGAPSAPPPGYGDTSGFPGGNEFNPSAPFGGQAAVTARPGTDAYKEQMNQRRYFCEAAPERC